jgi:FkbM family methyltransferase
LKDFKFLLEKYVLGQHGRRHPEAQVWKVVKKFRGFNFIDVGANNGLVYTFRLHDHFMRTYAIEPNPRLAESMRAEISRLRLADLGWGEVEVDEFAASDHNGEGCLYIGWDLGSSTIESVNVNERNGTDMRIVAMKKLDDWWGDAPVDFMKIDVEHAEFKVLAGAERILKLTKNVVIELHDKDNARGLGAIIRDRFPIVRWLDDTHILGQKP